MDLTNDEEHSNFIHRMKKMKVAKVMVNILNVLRQKK